jgi:hypothetical protein
MKNGVPHVHEIRIRRAASKGWLLKSDARKTSKPQPSIQVRPTQSIPNARRSSRARAAFFSAFASNSFETG